MKKIKVDKKFVLLMVMAFVFAMIQGGNLPYEIFYGFLITFVFAVLYLNRVIKGLNVRSSMDRRIYSTGDEGQMNIILENASLFPIIYLTVKSEMLGAVNEKYSGDAFSLNIDDHKIIKKSFSFNRRGVYGFSNYKVDVKDLFSIIGETREFKEEKVVRVYPRICPIRSTLANGGDMFMKINDNRGSLEDMSLTKDIRKYEYGDSLKKVHWKISAKHNELYVKNYENITGERCVIFFNMNEEDYFFDRGNEVEETMVSFCVSFINNLMSKKITTDVFINNIDSDRFQVENQEDFFVLMEYFIQSESKGKMDFSKYIYSNIGAVGTKDKVFVFTHSLESGFRKCVQDLSHTGVDVAIMYSSASVDDKEALRMLKNAGMPCITFSELKL